MAPKRNNPGPQQVKYSAVGVTAVYYIVKDARLRRKYYGGESGVRMPAAVKEGE